MKIKILYFFLIITLIVKAQNTADVDLTIGTNFKNFNYVSVIKLQSDNKIVVGGRQNLGSTSSSSIGRLVRFNPDGSIDENFNASVLLNDGVVNDVAIQQDGKILVGGYFSIANGTNVNKLIRLNSDGTIDTTFLYASGGYIKSIALQEDGKILIGGDLSAYVNNHQQRDLIRLNSNGTVDQTFDMGVLGGFQGTTSIYKVKIQPDGKILVGGYFYSFNGSQQNTLVRLNNNGTKDTTFDIGTGGGTNSVQDIILKPDGKILICGSVGGWNGQSTGGPIFRLNSNGSLDTSFVLGVPSNFIYNAELKQDGKIIVIGSFNLSGQTKRMISLNEDGSLNDSFNNLNIGGINSFHLQPDGKILVGGYFSEINNIVKNSFARLNSDGTLDLSFNLNTGLNDKVLTVALHTDNKTLLGGDFSTFDGISQNKIIRINDDGTRDTSFTIGTGFNGTVNKIVVQPDNKLLVGGNFTSYNGVSYNSLIRLNNDGTIDNTFSIGTGFDNYVKTIALQSDGKIVVGGNFTQFNGLPQNYCIRLNSDGTKDNSFVGQNAFNNRVTNIIIQSDNKLLIGGNFTQFEGLSQKHLIRINPNGTKDVSFDIGTGFYQFNSADVIKDLEISVDGRIYVVAQSASYNGTSSVGQILRLNSDGALDSTFTYVNISIAGEFVYSIAIQQNGKIVAGGSFKNVNGGNNNYRRLMRLNTDGTLDTTFDVIGGVVGSDGGLDAGLCSDLLIQPDGKIWVAGSFFAYRDVASFSAIRLIGDTVLSTSDFYNSESDFILYPNPVVNKLHFNKSFKSVTIFDVLGRKIKDIENSIEIDFSDFIPNVYFLSIENENGSIITKKIVKK